MTRRLLISIALGAAELAWDALRKAPGKAWAAAHAWLVVRAGESAPAASPTGETMACADLDGLDAEEGYVRTWEREPPVNAKGGRS